MTSATAGRKGEDPPLVKPFHIRFWFSDERRHSVSWEARCNGYGADARFTAHRIEVGLTSSTLVGCPPDQERDLARRNGELQDGQARVLCRHGTKRFVVQGFDLAAAPSSARP